MNIESAIQQILDALGIQLDGESFDNLVSLLPLSRIGTFQRIVIAAALGVVAGLIRKWLADRRAAAEIAAQAVTA